MSSTSAHNLTIPLNSSVAFPIGTQIIVEQLDTGLVTIAATGGVVIQGVTTTSGQYSVVSLIKQATDTWMSVGSGRSGFSGKSGYSGYSGYSGGSGYSGFSATGLSGFSGYSGAGTSGFSGFSGKSGYSGYSAATGASGFSGFSGPGGGSSGFSGYSSVSGFSGFSGSAGVATIPVGNTLYVDAVNGNDSTGTTGRFDKPYLTITAALADATAGDVVQVGPGTFTENVGIVLDNDVNLVGAGQGLTIIESTHDGSAATGNDNGLGIIAPGNNSVISDISILCDPFPATTEAVVPIYRTSSAGAKNWTNVTFRNCHLRGTKDVLINTATMGDMTFIDCNLESQNDVFSWQGIGSHAVLINCELRMTANVDGLSGTAIYNGDVGGGSTVKAYGCRIVYTSVNSTNAIYPIMSDEHLEVYDCVIDYTGQTPNAASKDIYVVTPNTMWISNIRKADGTALTYSGVPTDLGGVSGYSGYSGAGTSGFSGFSGKSGYSGYSGATAASGYSGYSSLSGFSGYSSLSGFSGFSGKSGYSGYSGYSGFSGYSGAGLSGYSGYSSISGYSGYSAFSGFSGTAATVNAAGQTYTMVIGDANQVLLHTSTATTYTIPANGSVAYPVGTIITIVNATGAGAITLAITTDTLQRGDGTAGTGNRTIAADSVVSIVKTAATTWYITGKFT